MPTLSDIRAQSSWGQVIEGQPQHAMIALLLTSGAGALLVSGGGPGLWGLSAVDWAWWSIGLALIHQIIVAAVFQHAYIWVHMYCTETPDLKLLHS
ncbi:MAG: hypothetical protein ACI8S6_000676 [Myxococcota bacterium]|jgi:hypothetical protein